MYIPAGTKRAADNSPYSRYKRRNPTWYFLAIGGGILLITLALVIFGLVTQELAILIFFVGIVGFLIFCIGIYWLIFRNRRQLLPRI
jgi:Na+/melibiose symporter-like transporter